MKIIIIPVTLLTTSLCTMADENVVYEERVVKLDLAKLKLETLVYHLNGELKKLLSGGELSDKKYLEKLIEILEARVGKLPKGKGPKIAVVEIDGPLFATVRVDRESIDLKVKLSKTLMKTGQRVITK